MLLAADGDIRMSISATTRPQRPGETEGADYHFVDDDEFDRLVAAGEFVEWAPVFGYRYGTPKAPVKQALRDGRDILFDIDWQGARQLEPSWVTPLRDLCLREHVPFFFKQWGGVRKGKAGRELDGTTYDELPPIITEPPPGDKDYDERLKKVIQLSKKFTPKLLLPLLRAVPA